MSDQEAPHNTIMHKPEVMADGTARVEKGMPLAVAYCHKLALQWHNASTRSIHKCKALGNTTYTVNFYKCTNSPTDPPAHRPIHPPAHLLTCPPTHPPTSPHIHSQTHPPTCPPTSPPTHFVPVVCLLSSWPVHLSESGEHRRLTCPLETDC